MKYDTVIWDFNGTVIDDVSLGISAVNVLLEKRGLPILTTAEEYRSRMRFPIIEYYRDLGFDFASEPYEVIAREWVELYKAGEEKCPPCTGAVEAIEMLSRAGVEQTILSASEREMLLSSLRRLGLEECFSYISAQNNVYAEGKLGAAREMRTFLSSRRAVMIGDTPHDLEAARIMGTDCILFTGGHGKYSELRSFGVPLVDDLRQAAKLILS